MSKGIDSVLRASVRVAFAVTIYLGATRDLSAQITQDASARSLVFLKPGGTIETNNGSDASFSGAVLGPGALTETGAGMLTLTGTNTCAGGTNINGGTLAVENGENLGSGPLSFHSGTLESLSIGDGLVFANSITLYAGGGTFLADAGTTSTLSGVIGGNGVLIKDGPGTLVLTGTNTYTGGTDLNAGTVVVDSYNNLGKGPIRLRGGTLKVLGGN